MATHEETRAALVASIEKWKANETAETFGDVSIHGDDCALCRLFLTEEYDSEDSCGECPVALKDGQKYCRGTPYYEARSSFWRLDLPAFRLAARAEREFLESLLAEMDAAESVASVEPASVAEGRAS